MSKPGPRRLLALLVSMALVAAACGSSSNGPDGGDAREQPTQVSTVDPAQVTGAFSFAKVAESVESGSSFRADTFFTIDMGPGLALGSDTEPMATMETDGAVIHVVSDMGAMLADGPFAPPGLAEHRDELTMESYSDGQILLVKVPFAGVLHDLGLGFFPRALRELDDNWGLVRLSEVGGLAQAMGGTSNSGVIDPESVARLVAAIADPSEGETVTVRGVEATQVTGKVEFGELVAAQGMDPEEFVSSMTELFPVSNGAERQMVDDTLAGLLAAPTEVTVAYDDQFRLRVLETRMDLGDLLSQIAESAAQASGEELSPQDLSDLRSQLDLSMVTRIEVYDYDSPDIDLTMPDVSSAVDVTDVFDQLFAGGLGAGF